MSSITSVSNVPVARHAAPIARPIDADGDHDGGRKAVHATVSPQPLPKLAVSGTVGRNVNTRA